MNKKKLKDKGWQDIEIRQAERIIDRASVQDLFFSKMVFWSALVVIIFANVLISFILIPYLIVLQGAVLFSLIGILGLVVGFLYNFLMMDIGLLEKKHHRLAGIVLILIGLANFFGMVIVANKFIADVLVKTVPHNPWIISGIFVSAFILPYVVNQIRRSFL